jgi:hypothetical protein
MESVEYIAVVSLPTKLMDEVEIDDKDDRSQGVKIYHLSVVRTQNPEHARRLFHDVESIYDTRCPKHSLIPTGP